MSSKNNIDEFFKNNLDEKGLDYTEDRWVAMENLLNQKKSGLFFSKKWYYAAMAFLFVLMGTLLLLNDLFNKNENVPFTEKYKPQATTDAKSYGIIRIEKHATATLESSSSEKRSESSDVRGGIEKTNKASADDAIEINAGPDANSGFGGQAEVVNVPETLEGPVSEETFVPEMQNSVLVTRITRVHIPEILSKNESQPENNIPGIHPNKFRLPLFKPEMFVNPYINYGQFKQVAEKALTDWKKNYEDPVSYKGFGLDVRMEKNNFSLVSGLGALQLTEQTNYISQMNRFTFDTSYHLIDRNFYKLPDGKYAALLERQVDTTSVTTKDTVFCKDCLTKFTYLTIPLAVQYGYEAGKIVCFGEMGFNFAFIRKVQGLYSNRSLGTDENNPETGRVLKEDLSKALVQFKAAAGIRYRFAPSVSLNTRIEYHRALNSMMIDYTQKPSLVGIRVGMEWLIY